MKRERKCSQNGRVVVLTRDGFRLDAGLPEVAAAYSGGICVATGYEAAAELFAAPVRALVIDLSLLTRRHLRLMELARDLSAEVLAVGSVPTGFGSEQLSGVRLVSRADLPKLLERLLESAPSPPAPDEADTAPAIEPREEAPQPPAEKPAPTEEPAVVENVSNERQDNGDYVPTKLGDVLTSEEIAALLANAL